VQNTLKNLFKICYYALRFKVILHILYVVLDICESVFLRAGLTVKCCKRHC